MDLVRKGEVRDPVTSSLCLPSFFFFFLHGKLMDLKKTGKIQLTFVKTEIKETRLLFFTTNRTLFPHLLKPQRIIPEVSVQKN